MNLGAPGPDIRQTNSLRELRYILPRIIWGLLGALTNASGAVVETFRYDSFGNSSERTNSGRLFTGIELDSTPDRDESKY